MTTRPGLQWRQVGRRLVATSSIHDDGDACHYYISPPHGPRVWWAMYGDRELVSASQRHDSLDAAKAAAEAIEQDMIELHEREARARGDA